MRSLKSKLTKTARPFCFKPSPTDRRFYTRDSSDPSKFRLKDTQWKKPATHDRDMNRLDLPIRDPIEAQRKPQRTQEELADVLQGFLHPNQHNSKSTARDIGSIRKSINSDTSYPRSGKPFKRFPSDRFASKDIRSPDGSSNWSTDRRYPKASQPLPFSRSPSRTDVPTPKRDWKSPRPPPWPKRLPAVEKPAQPWPRHDAPDQPFRAAPAPVTTPTPIQQPRPSVAPAVVDPQAPAEIIEPEVAAEEIDDLTDIGDVSRPKSKLVRRDEGRSKEGLSKRERFFKKKQEDELDDGLTYDELELSERKKEKKQTIKVEEKIKKEVYLPEAISVANLAKVIGLRLDKFERKLQELGIEYTTHDHLLTSEVASLIALEYDLNPVINQDVAIDLFPKPKPSDMSIYPLRPPVVTIMGHVDHGKTTLLDSLRKTSVAAGEAGGITQHIGAFSVTLPSKKTITFLDTPGHAAFTAMRARGAHVTDIVVLVVAADDGVKPQTIEAIQHAKDANVPLIVAINKIDKHDANLDIVREGLLKHEIFLEEDGGETQSIQVSALKGKGLDDLEEAIVALAEMLDIRAEVDIGCEGYVIESQVEKGRGNVATVLVKRGTLKVGSIIVAGRSWCKVRNMVDENGKTMKQVLPGTPVKVIGWKELPNAGDEVLEAENEDLAKKVTENRTLKHIREQQVKDLEVINEKRRQRKEEIHEERSQMRDMKRAVWMYYQGLLPEYPSRPPPVVKPTNEDEKQVKRLCVVVKGDVSGTVEAVVNALDEVGNNEIRVDVIDFGVGDVTESDIQMAAATEGGIIIGFNVKAGKKVQSEASRLKVDILTFNIIYKLLEEVKSRLTSLLPPIIETHVTGEATILQIFQITVKGKQQKPIAGCRVTNGTILKNQRVRVMRGSRMIWEGALESLKQVKKDMTEVKKGMECGMGFDDNFEFQEGDLIQSIVTKEIPRSL